MVLLPRADGYPDTDGYPYHHADTDCDAYLHTYASHYAHPETDTYPDSNSRSFVMQLENKWNVHSGLGGVTTRQSKR